MAGWWFLIVAVLGALLVADAARPSTGAVSVLPSWILAFLTTDLTPFHLLLAALVSLPFTWGGALASIPGQLALLVVAGSSLWLIGLWLPSLGAKRVAASAARELGLDDAPAVPAALMLTPFARRRDGVEILRNIEFRRAAGRNLTLDVYRPEAQSDTRPALVYLHGGGWILGDKKDQGIPLCNHMAALGWVCVNANYRLSPGATWPDHLVDARAAIAWLREHADEHGVDPGFVAIAGGSAGAHIAAMAALAADEEGLKPGLEHADTSLQAVVTLYGAYDLAGRTGAYNPEFLTKYIGPLVIKAFPGEQPERFEAASPHEHVANVAQPWLLLHGDGDTLTPVADAREFVAGLADASERMVGYAEFPGAQHAFDIYYSPRANAAVTLAGRFLATVHARARRLRED